LAKADAMRGALMRGPTRLLAARKDPSVDALEAYEIKRWPLGKEPGGKG
jgi:hypothetical protein